ncbi:MAG: tannase/feruloyl esterase family alpha/beta hydrolase [Pseudomonadota bacterium]
MKSSASNTRTTLSQLLCFSACGLLIACSEQPAEPVAQPAAEPVASAPSAADACQQLTSMTFTPDSIGLPTTGANVVSAELISSTATDNTNGEYCKVLGAIHPVDSTAPDINFEVNLPTNWNNKMLQFGGGGLNGNLVTGLARYAKQPESEQTPLARGYVTLGSDSGHKGAGGFDGTFYLNAEALDNFGHMQIKKTHDVAMQLIAARYGAAPEHSYFIGGSQGGHEGFDAVQRYPDDYDGVVAGYPAHNEVMLHLAAWNFAKALQANDGKSWLNPVEAELLVATVYERCDALDNASDGIISNVTACKETNAPLKLTTTENPLRCADGADTGDTCLSDAQIEALNAVDVPYAVGFPIFPDDTQSAEFPKWTPFEGSTFKDGGLSILGAEGPQQALQYAPGAATLGLAIAEDPALNVYENFDPLQFEARIKDIVPRLSANSIDLDKWRANGGKLIYFHGLVDDFISPYSSIQYWNRLQTRYDAAALDEFVKFYTIPGMGHVTGVFNARLSSLDALEAWVEQGTAPGELVASDANQASAGRTRPVCFYPAWPKYDGSGDINAATSFSCVVE